MSCENLNILTYYGPWESSPFSINEKFFIENGYVSQSVVRDKRNALKRSLSYQELKVLSILEQNGVLLTEDLFKPYPS
ncbi:hypothetical protein [Chryseobacterium oncorhynchi]|uniref:Uncharacterized protein n=1 Tax=Chryseobacterium oncorhynchi TaxID=741074 RepID=A0A316X1F8_9FLAO|nr:hypothetical protein [Chryseobacterium oncorhynchi]PWN67591.1 hypothetical protein C1638_003095 [Chryseobacterium oncorhynchi]